MTEEPFEVDRVGENSEDTGEKNEALFLGSLGVREDE